MKFSIGRLWAVALLAIVSLMAIERSQAQPGVVDYSGGGTRTTNAPGVWDLVNTNTINTLGIARWVGTNVFDLYGSNANCAVLHSGTWTYYSNSALRDLTNAAAAMVSGDELHLNTNALIVSNAWTKPGIKIVGRGDSSELRSWVALSNGLPVTLRSNLTAVNFRVTRMLSNGAFTGAIGGNSAAGDTNWDGVYMRGVTATNGDSDDLYVSVIGFTRGLVEGCHFGASGSPGTKWDAGAMFLSKTSIWSFNGNYWSVKGPSGLNANGEAHAWWATAGTNLHYNSTFEVSGVPTSSVTTSNNFAAALRDDLGSGYVSFIGCTFLHSGVAGRHWAFGNLPRVATPPYDAVYGGLTNQLGTAVFDVLPDSVTGSVQVLSVPIAWGVAEVDNTNTLFVAGSGDAAGAYTNTMGANLPESGVPGYAQVGGSFEVARTNGVWVILDDFGSILYTNVPSATSPTNRTWGTNAGAGPMGIVVWDRRSRSWGAFRSSAGVVTTNWIEP